MCGWVGTGEQRRASRDVVEDHAGQGVPAPVVAGRCGLVTGCVAVAGSGEHRSDRGVEEPSPDPSVVQPGQRERGGTVCGVGPRTHRQHFSTRVRSRQDGLNEVASPEDPGNYQALAVNLDTVDVREHEPWRYQQAQAPGGSNDLDASDGHVSGA